MSRGGCINDAIGDRARGLRHVWIQRIAREKFPYSFKGGYAAGRTLRGRSSLRCGPRSKRSTTGSSNLRVRLGSRQCPWDGSRVSPEMCTLQGQALVLLDDCTSCSQERIIERGLKETLCPLKSRRTLSYLIQILN